MRPGQSAHVKGAKASPSATQPLPLLTPRTRAGLLSPTAIPFFFLPPLLVRSFRVRSSFVTPSPLSPPPAHLR